MGLPTEMICGKLLGEVDAGLSAVSRAQGQLTGMIRDLENKLSLNISLPPTPLNEMNNALNQLNAQANSMIDAISSDLGLAEVINVINSCSALEAEDPLALVAKLKDELLGEVRNGMAALGGLIPEIDLSIDLDLFGGKVSELELDSVIPNLDKALNCLSAVCGQDVGARVDQLQGLMNNMRLGDGGLPDIDGLIGNVAGVPGEMANNIKNGAAGLQQAGANIVSAIDPSNIVEKLNPLG